MDDSVRKCIYTGEKATAKDSVLPREVIGEENIHNWDNKSPISEDYKNFKRDDFPTDLEMEANKTFHLLELAKLDVIFYENKLKKIQENINLEFKQTKEKMIDRKEKNKVNKKEREIKKAHMEKDINEAQDKAWEEQLNKRMSKLWE